MPFFIVIIHFGKVLINLAKIRPFRGLRFNTGKAGDIKTLVCPPYDIVSAEEREELVSRNKYNMINLELPVGEDRYSKAGELYSSWLRNGVLEQDEKPSIYVYEEEFTVKGVTRRIKGIITRVFLEPFSKGVVLPHEETLSKAKADRFELMCATGCNFSQIYSLYSDGDGSIFAHIDGLSKGNPDVCFTDEVGVTHRLWTLDDGEVLAYFERAFEDKQLFIADGHHRYETALNYRQKLIDDGFVKSDEDDANYVMMMLVDLENEGLVVFPTHRIVRDLPDFDEEKILEAVKKDFDVKQLDYSIDLEAELAKYADKKAFVMCFNDAPYLVVLKNKEAVKKAFPEKCEAYRALDVAVLHSVILEPIFGIDKENMAKQINLKYTRDVDEAVAGVKSGSYQCAFILNPTKVSEIKDVALANEKMPQKSTYFYPKIITGLVINKII